MPEDSRPELTIEVGEFSRDANSAADHTAWLLGFGRDDGSGERILRQRSVRAAAGYGGQSRRVGLDRQRADPDAPRDDDGSCLRSS